ncbi:unnamed protein product (macronuclear) [Paramecium tetraurelia]|uniref:Uncharacterized protein n=1 Tax=Paramecium tetraurelia TaxID=5888 RepID=A0CKJ3_PARTE|nr:uncharacterized protein GSPATT00001024001 [Paramecium tetraurelia]CAK71310.1 unnamed protein product [Paramecium tetraurelia]|eukprot:XP_001438707.1 hypothetical protein (macronuclear) [Paramecium tetraurelia strain d4-2]
MLSFFEYDELETDYKRVIKYPFVVSELLGSLYALNAKHLNFLIQLLNTQNTLPSITIGHVSKVIMNVLKTNPCIFWQNVQLSQLSILIQDINNYSIAELIYSMIIYQTQENQLEHMDKRIELVNHLLNDLNTDKCEGISIVICMVLNQITETLQEQKSLIIKHIFTKLDTFLSALSNHPQPILNILIGLINHQEQYKQEVTQIYNRFIQTTKDFFQNILNKENTFGLNNLTYIQFYDVLTNQPYILENINRQELAQALFQLIQKYQQHNQLHKYATNIILKLIPQTDTQQLLQTAISEFKMKPVKENRGYVIQIINKIYEVSNQQVQEEELQNQNSIQNNYFFGHVPDQRPIFNLQEEFEAAMNKLQI